MESTKNFAIIVAADMDGGIGAGNALPWRLKADMEFFKKFTIGNGKNAVVMGRKTWDSIPQKFRPLPNRINVVISRNKAVHSKLETLENVLASSSFSDAMTKAANAENIFVIGGGSIYKQALASKQCNRICLTRVHSKFKCDTKFEFDESLFSVDKQSEMHEEKGLKFQFIQLVRKPSDAGDASKRALKESEPAAAISPKKKPKLPHVKPSTPHEEMQYINLIKEILEHGVKRGDRTGTGTLSKFGAQMRFSLRDGVFPLLTTKRVFWRGLAEELFWFIAGSTDANLLAAKRVHIWDANGSREFLDKQGLQHREVGDLGPVYGFQWRHFGAEYKGKDADYTGKGVDQLANVIHTIKTNPNCRRIIMTAWNPAVLKEVALPPCHMMAQFYVANGELSCQMYQRSADMGLGVPFNIASYALLTRLIAHCCDLKAGDFVHVIGDAHVYLNHIDALGLQIKREPRPFPKLHITSTNKDIDSLSYADLKIEGYKPHKSIKMKMAV